MINNWDGSSWNEISSLYHWDGSQWLEASGAYYWDGSQWVQIWSPIPKTTFSEYSTGSQPSDWTDVWGNSANDDWNVIDEANSVIGTSPVGTQLLEFSSSTNDSTYRGLTWDEVSGISDSETLCLVRFSYSNITTGPGVLLRAGGGSGSQEGYRFFLNNIAQEFDLQRLDGDGNATYLVRPSMTISNNTDYWIKTRCVGTSLKGKAWEYGTTEPSWMIDTTDSTYSSGDTGVMIFKNDESQEFLQFQCETL